MKSILVLGAGRVARPCIQYLLGQGYAVTAAGPLGGTICATPWGITPEALVGWPTRARRWGPLVAETRPDLMVSLLPPRFMAEGAPNLPGGPKSPWCIRPIWTRSNGPSGRPAPRRGWWCSRNWAWTRGSTICPPPETVRTDPGAGRAGPILPVPLRGPPGGGGPTPTPWGYKLSWAPEKPHRGQPPERLHPGGRPDRSIAPTGRPTGTWIWWRSKAWAGSRPTPTGTPSPTGRPTASRRSGDLGPRHPAVPRLVRGPSEP